ncbi:MAG: endolytic transglycosylase MltG [Spirochaetales bacterium]|nr:endolytic transglycosylase MltG [Spirochaetales bacterium]
MKDKRKRRRPRRLLTGVAILFFLAFALAAGGLLAFANLDAPTGLVETGGSPFEVRAGDSGDGVAARLEREGLIRSALLFRALVRLRGEAGQVKAGTYLVTPELTTGEVLALLASGRQMLVRVTIPEGLASRKVAELLSEAGICEADAFLAATRDQALLSGLGIPSGSAEGYLFPDTYLFEPDTDPARVVRAMVDGFRGALEREAPEALSLEPGKLHEKVVLASIVEREYRAPDEAPLMAGVFYNRIQIGMPLQSCATVVYVITEELGKPHPELLLYRDLEIESPFNTYMYRGLPPAPIANPGLVALVAALEPEETDYLYFRLVDAAAGRHKFSVTYDEHEDAAPLAVKRSGS